MLSVCRAAVAVALAVILLRPVAAGAEASSIRPDYTELVLRGDGMRQDSFSLALQAAARALGRDVDYQTVAALTTMVFFQFYQAFNCRSETQSVFRMSLLSNPFLLFSLVAAFFAQLAVLYVPALQWVFRTVPLTIGEWLQIAAVTSTVIVGVEIDKWIRNRARVDRRD